MNASGVLILSHVGFSFLEDLVEIMTARGLRSFVLSSSPLPAKRAERLEQVEKLAARLFTSDSHVLVGNDVQSALATLALEGEKVLCCVTVWEGYRGLMALANETLGVADLTVAEVERLRDKLAVRNRLAAAGLSNARAIALTPESLADLRQSGRRYFIKPCAGIASFGAFPLRRDTTWSQIERISELGAADPVYGSAFNGAPRFLAEDYLPGREFSFEVLVAERRVHVVAIHEKCEVTEGQGTVLEESCTSPPHSIDRADCAAGIAWLQRVLGLMAVRWGCFHVEARCHEGRWDLIEINPRVGGCLISRSVQALTGGRAMLDLWVDLLLVGAGAQPERRAAFFSELSQLAFTAAGEPPTQTATFFRAYFASPGQKLEHVALRETTPAPAFAQVLLKAGDRVSDSPCEAFLGQILWSVSLAERNSRLAHLLRVSRDAIDVRYAPAGPTLLVVDYNLTRVDDVARIATYVRQRHSGKVALVRANPTPRDFEVADYVVDLDPRKEGFVESAREQLEPLRGELRGGVVLSDNAVQSGAALLEALGLAVDSAALAQGAFSKHLYRQSELRHSELFHAQRVMVPESVEVHALADIHAFAVKHRKGFVVKPSCEGNNRGVVMVREGDDLKAAFNEVAPYLADGVICEQAIPYRREYSYDGLGSLAFITEKVSAEGRYPVEIAQIQPAQLTEEERATLGRAGRLANLLVGQCDGPFHNEIKLSDDGRHAAIVEPNRRPGGMRIWSLAKWVYGIDLYERWVDTVLGLQQTPLAISPTRSAATVMLGVLHDRTFYPQDIHPENTLLADALAATASTHGLGTEDLRVQEFGWTSQRSRFVPKVPRDNADFVAYACVLLETNTVRIHDVIPTLREKWALVLEQYLRDQAIESENDIQAQAS